MFALKNVPADPFESCSVVNSKYSCLTAYNYRKQRFAYVGPDCEPADPV